MIRKEGTVATYRESAAMADLMVCHMRWEILVCNSPFFLRKNKPGSCAALPLTPQQPQICRICYSSFPKAANSSAPEKMHRSEILKIIRLSLLIGVRKLK